MIRFILPLLLAAGTTPALAQRESKVDGSRLLALCSGRAGEACNAYIAGVADAIAAGGKANAAACIPIAVTETQLREVVLKYLRTRPEKLQHKAGTLVLEAYAQAFPCR